MEKQKEASFLEVIGACAVLAVIGWELATGTLMTLLCIGSVVDKQLKATGLHWK